MPPLLQSSWILLGASLVLFLATPSLAAAQPIHHHMSPEELRHIFQVESHDQVPQYEVVRVRSLAHASPPASDVTVTTSSEAPVDAKSAGGSTPSSTTTTTSTSSAPAQSPAPARTVHLHAFGQALSLRLRPAQGLVRGGQLRAWTAHANDSAPHSLHLDELPSHTEEELGHAYQDERTLAALLLRKESSDGGLLMEGTIGHDLVVRPVPARVRQHLDEATVVDDEDAVLDEAADDDEAWLDGADEDVQDDEAVRQGFPLGRRRRRSASQPRPPSHLEHTHPHIVIKRRAAAADDQPSDYDFMEPDLLLKRVRRARRSSRPTREAPYVIYPEILVIVDYDGYRLHGGDNVQIKRYFVSFWNGVDLRYKLLKGPKIRISIAGIIISRGRDATPYLERNRVGRDAIDSAAALTDMGKYLFRERRLPVYDIAVAITKYDMCRRRKGGRCTKGTAGFAYVGGACVVNKRLEKVNSVAIIEDTGGFSGIIVGAHEVGHLLGAVHDGSPPPSYLGGPGAEKCRWEDGFIMSDLRHTEKGFRWSPCSVASFHHFLNGDTATCLYNSPHEDESLPRVLPGKLLTLDAQCRKDRGTSACFKDDRVCAQLFCFDAGSGYCVAYRPAAEGSPCGDGQFCMNGRCVAEHENIIPDYSQNTPTYIRRSDADSAATQSRPVYASALNITRSPWDSARGWGSSSTYSPEVPSSTPTTEKSPQNYYNPYFTISSTENPYYQYNTATQNPYSQIKHSASYDNLGPKASVTSARPPYSVNFNPYYHPSTTRNPYDFSNFRQQRRVNSIRQTTTQNPYQQYFSVTTTRSPYQPYNLLHATTKRYQSPYYSAASNNQPTIIRNNNSTIDMTPTNTALVTDSVADTDCEDKVKDIAGSMTCREFLSHYGFQYCSYRYMQQNCCKSQKEICGSRNSRKRK